MPTSKYCTERRRQLLTVKNDLEQVELRKQLQPSRQYRSSFSILPFGRSGITKCY